MSLSDYTASSYNVLVRVRHTFVTVTVTMTTSQLNVGGHVTQQSDVPVRECRVVDECRVRDARQRR